VANFAVNLLAALVAYTYQEKKPSLNLDPYVELTLQASERRKRPSDFDHAD